MGRFLYSSLLVYCLASAKRIPKKECNDLKFSIKPASYHLQQNEYWAEESEVRECLHSVTPLLGKWGVVWISEDKKSWTETSMTPRKLGGESYGWRINRDNSSSAFAGNRLVAENLKKKSVLEQLKNGMFNQTSVKLSNKWLKTVAIHGNVAYAAGNDKIIYAVDLSSMQVKKRASGQDYLVTCIDVTEHMLITGSKDKSLKIWNRQNMTLITTLRDHTEAVFGCRIDGTTMITSSRDKTSIVYDIRVPSSPVLKWKLAGHTRVVRAVDTTGDYIATASADLKGRSSIKVWSRLNGTLLQTLTGGSGLIVVHFLDSEIIVSASPTELLFWNFRRSQAPHTRRTGCQYKFFVRNGLIFCRSDQTNIAVWDITNGVDNIPEKPTTLVSTTHGRRITDIDVSDNKVVSVGFDGILNVITVNP